MACVFDLTPLKPIVYVYVRLLRQLLLLLLPPRPPLLQESGQGLRGARWKGGGRRISRRPHGQGQQSLQGAGGRSGGEGRLHGNMMVRKMRQSGLTALVMRYDGK